MPEKHSLHKEDLEEVCRLFREIVPIQDRKYGFPGTTYRDCFVGEEAVTKLIEHGMALDEEDALRLGNILLESGFFHHVQKAHCFKNEYLFYRFIADEDHGGVAVEDGKGNAFMWQDFLGGHLPERKGKTSLLPQIPEPDTELGELESIDLETVGISPLDEHNAKLLDNVHPRNWVDPQPKSVYNLVVIGAGAGGLVSAAAAAGVGARVALIESHLMGGDCLNVGCVPSKALLSCAKAASVVRHAQAYGLRLEGEVHIDFAAVMQRLRKIRARISPLDSAKRYSEQLGVDVFQGRAVFTGKNSVEVNGKTLSFSKAVIATGGTAAIPNIAGLSTSRYLTNNSVFNLTERPGRLAVIGAGPIGLELAQAFCRLGSDVTVFSRSERIMPKEDPEAADIVKNSMIDDGVKFVFNAEYTRIEGDRQDRPVSIFYKRDGLQETLECDHVLIATGRKPAVSGLGLEEAGVEYDLRKGVLVNDRLQTSNPDIYGVGDVASRYQFTHVADFMARLVIKNALFFGRDKVSDLLIPWATYTDPEVAHVGLYEKDLKERNIDYTTFTRTFSDVDRAIVEGKEIGFVKIHVARAKGEILGATIVGDHAGDMISEISVAIHAGMRLGTLASVIHPYPTLAEAIRQCGDAYNRQRLTPAVKSIFHRLMSMRR